MKLAQRLLLLIVCGIIFSCLPLRAELPKRLPVKKVIFKPRSMKWLKRWKEMAVFPYIHPDMAKAKINIPQYYDVNRGIVDCDLVFNGKKVGSLAISMPSETILGIHKYRREDKTVNKQGDINKAREVTRKFVKQFYTGIPGPMITTEYRTSEISYCYLYRDVVIRDIVIDLDNDGFIIGIGDIDASRNMGRDVHKLIPPSMGESKAREIFKAYLMKQKITYEKISVDRRMDWLRGQNMPPKFRWHALIVIGNVKNSHLASINYFEVKYDELTKTFVDGRYYSLP